MPHSGVHFFGVTMAILESRSARVDPRIPFFTPVVTARLSRCWATNISSSGIGLSGYSVGPQPIAKGEELDLQFELGESKRTLQLAGRVTWTSLVRADGRVGLGVQFIDPPAAIRGTLVRFLAEHRPRILALFPNREETTLLRHALAHVTVELVGDLGEIDEELVRACAAIIVFANDVQRLTTAIDALHGRTSAALPHELPLPQITLCSNLDPEKLLPSLGAGKVYEVLRPPLEGKVLALAIDRSCEHWALHQELRWASLQLEGLRSPPVQRTERPRSGRIGRVVKSSSAMRRVYELIQTVAAHDVPVLLTGETGTGKELAAREIHAQSRRANTPFVAQDCGALTETLLESELFGHVRGAFTGATTDHPGLFQIADGGTIFLDEIQNTSATLQAKLLRVIEEGEVRPVGGARPRQVDVRLLAACNVDLKNAVKEGRFRSDVYYRINRFPIELPPLREHPDDIAPLVRHFLTAVCESMGRDVPAFAPNVEFLLRAYDWPGNIRELRNVIERAVLLTPPGEQITIESLPDDVRASVLPPEPVSGSLVAQLDDYERTLIQAALGRHEGIIRRAARDLEINAVTLSRRMRRLGMLDED